jgi:hypothetical protein
MTSSASALDFAHDARTGEPLDPAGALRRYMIELARRLGRTADELGRTMSAAELMEQRALDLELAAERRRAEEARRK